MNEPNAESQNEPDTSPDIDSGAMRQCDSPVGGGKTMTVFGALFGAAAAVPT